MNSDSGSTSGVGSPVGDSAVGDTLEKVKWTNEDELWVSNIPPHLAPVARRHGRELFCYVMQGNEVAVALNQLTKRLRGNRELMFALDVVIATMNDLSQGRFQQGGWTSAQVMEVQQDAMRATQLANVGPEQRTASGLIIAH